MWPKKKFSDLEEFKKNLVAIGYENTGQVQKEGEFSVRGGIVDVFPLTEGNAHIVSNCGATKSTESDALT